MDCDNHCRLYGREFGWERCTFGGFLAGVILGGISNENILKSSVVAEDVSMKARSGVDCESLSF
jgi:hypothetical protein